MSYTIDKFRQLREARKLNRFGSVASLSAQGVGNDMADAQRKPSKKTKKASTKKSIAKKTTAPAKKTVTKKAASAKKTTTKKS